jgi:two-component system chemotaxis family response regulator WspR
MPEIDGLSLLRYLRANGSTKDIPILMLSSTEDPAVKAEAFSNGANDYQIKIPDKAELLARVRYHATSYSNLIAKEATYLALQKSQQKLAVINQKLQQLAALDGLTGISNRRFFDEQLDKEWRRALRSDTPLSLIMADIDHFKLYNDEYGHIEGDNCLRQVAQTIEHCFQRGSDLVARYGGEEFVVVAPLLTCEQATRKAELMLTAIADLHLEHKASPTASCVTVSAGIASCMPQSELSPTQLVESADHALYEAKEAGRNRVASSPGLCCTVHTPPD